MISTKDYKPLLIQCTQALYDAVFIHQETWHKCNSSLEGDVAIFSRRQQSKDGSYYVSKSVTKFSVDANTAMSSAFDKKRMHEFDEYFSKMEVIQNYGAISVELTDGTIVDFQHYMLAQTNYHGLWPLFSPRDAVHLFGLGSFQKNGRDHIICSVVSIPSTDAKSVPMGKHVVRVNVIEAGALAIPLDDSSCEVQQLNHIDLGGWVPKKAMEFLSFVEISMNEKFKHAAEKRSGDYDDDLVKSGKVLKNMCGMDTISDKKLSLA